LPYSKKIIKQAINFELKRKGQVYFLHNRVESIEKIKTGLEKLVPKAKISFIHGKMPEQKLVKIMDDFQNNKINILVATTIIENGIDLPNVNTIIIEDATRLGLSQAYQIRGRVGRSNIQSFAYLFFAPQHLTEIANPVRKLNKQNTYSTQGANLIKKHASKSSFNGLSNGAKERLKALEEATELGAGYRIALKDLELRGAGNILGKEQSGSINKIGLNLYCQMLSEAVEKLKN
jgi:transcription-repair coupling factor (superfamily II helicase)